MALGQRLLAFTGQRQGDTGNVRLWITCPQGSEAAALLRGEPMGESYFATRWDAVASWMGAAAITKLDVHQDRLNDEQNRNDF
jgi:hypothetical protein